MIGRKASDMSPTVSVLVCIRCRCYSNVVGKLDLILLSCDRGHAQLYSSTPTTVGQLGSAFETIGQIIDNNKFTDSEDNVVICSVYYCVATLDCGGEVTDGGGNALLAAFFRRLSRLLLLCGGFPPFWSAAA